MITRGIVDAYASSSQSPEELTAWLSTMQTTRGKGMTEFFRIDGLAVGFTNAECSAMNSDPIVRNVRAA